VPDLRGVRPQRPARAGPALRAHRQGEDEPRGDRDHRPAVAGRRARGGGYVTPQFIRSIAQKVPGLDVQRLVRDERSPAAEAIQREAVQLAARFGVDSTPTFELSRTGGKPTEVQLTQLSPDELAAAIDRLLAKR
jgi:hypothetical protein